MSAVDRANIRAAEDAESEIRQRRGRRSYLEENIPKRESGVRHCDALIRNQSRPNAHELLEHAKFRLERTKASIVENEEISVELEKAIAVLNNGETARTTEPLEVVEARESDARDVIARYTKKNSVTRKSHIDYGYNL